MIGILVLGLVSVVGIGVIMLFYRHTPDPRNQYSVFNNNIQIRTNPETTIGDLRPQESAKYAKYGENKTIRAHRAEKGEYNQGVIYSNEGTSRDEEEEVAQWYSVPTSNAEVTEDDQKSDGEESSGASYTKGAGIAAN